MGKEISSRKRRARERRRDALRMREAGLTYWEIAERMRSETGGGTISTARARQMVEQETRIREHQRRQDFIASTESTATYEFNGRKMKFYRRGDFVTIYS